MESLSLIHFVVLTMFNFNENCNFKLNTLLDLIDAI